MLGTVRVLGTVRQRVLVIEDHPTVSDVVRRYLERAGYDVVQAVDGRTALDRFADERPDLVVLDLALPGLDSPEVCHLLTRRRADVPMIVVTALGEQSDRLLGLRVGADDYVTKPFSPRELVRRVQSVLRAGPPLTVEPGSGHLTDGDLVVSTGTRVARLAGAELVLTAREFDLLVHFLRHPAQVFRRGELLRAVWGWDVQDHATVTVHVGRLREKLERDPARPCRLVTVWGVGYRYDLRACS